MAPIRKCKACFRPAKGHPGPYGLTKCKNEPVETNDNEDVNQKLISNIEANMDEASKEVFDSEQRRRSIVENLVNNIVRENEVEVFQPVEDARKNGDVNIDVNISSGDVNHLESLFEGQDHAEVVEVGHNEAAENSNHEDDVRESSMESSGIPDCSLGEASLCFNDESSEEVRRRLASQSDTNVDIRNLILGRAFVLCVCDNFDCECEGEIRFSKSFVGEAGSVENLYMDPITDFEADLKPNLIFSKGGWKVKTPNCIKFKVGGVTSPTVASSSGEVHLTASRVVELVKGRKELSTVIRGKLELALEVGQEYAKKGFGNPVKFKDIECNLYMLEDDAEEATDANC